jgi:membrane associated rhomboid family serine protease
MLPLRDENPTRRFPVLTVGLIALNVAAFLYQLSRPNDGNENDSQDAVVCKWGAIPGVIFHNAGSVRPPGDATCEFLNNQEPAFSSLVTSQFLHGGWAHLLGNMLFLWVFGNNVEDRLGRLRFLPFYLFGGVAAALAQGLTDTNSLSPLIGASGAISAVLGAYLILYPRAKVLTLLGWIPLRIPAWAVIGGFIALQFFYLAGQTSNGDSVAYWAHVGGFVAGALFIKVFLFGRREHAPHPDDVASHWNLPR